MSGVEVLEYEHTIVALEIMEDHDDASFLAVFIDGETVQMLKHGLYAVFPIEGYGVLAFFIFETEENGCLYTFFVSDGFEVSEHEERRGILYPHIPIFIYTDHGSRSHLRGKDFMQFGFVILGVDGLNKTLMRGQLYLYFTEGTFPPAALVIELNTFTISSTFCPFKRSLIHLVALKAFLFEITQGTIFGRGRDFMSGVAGFSEEAAMTMTAG